MVIQNISSDQKTTDITFTVKRDDILKTKKILKENNNINYKEIIQNENVAKFQLLVLVWSRRLELPTECSELCLMKRSIFLQYLHLK